MERATLRRARRTGQVALQNDAFFLHAYPRNRHGREQSLRIWVQLVVIQLILRRQLDNLAKIHDADAVGNVRTTDRSCEMKGEN